MKRIKKLYTKIRMKWECSLIKKNMVLKKEIKRLNKLIEATKEENHKLIDQKTLDNLKMREMYLENKNETN